MSSSKTIHPDHDISNHHYYDNCTNIAPIIATLLVLSQLSTLTNIFLPKWTSYIAKICTIQLLTKLFCKICQQSILPQPGKSVNQLCYSSFKWGPCYLLSSHCSVTNFITRFLVTQLWKHTDPHIATTRASPDICIPCIYGFGK